MEEWKDIEGYEWIYQISNLWRVKSLKFWKEIILKQNKHRDWYSLIGLSNKWVKNICVSSRLVAIHFIPNPLNLPCVLHKIETLDENWMLYNWEDNLFWGTHKENMQDMHRKWRANNCFNIKALKSMLWKFWENHNRSRKIIQFSKKWEFIKEWWSIIDCWKNLKIHKWSISHCCRWNTKTAGWFIFKYKNLWELKNV